MDIQKTYEALTSPCPPEHLMRAGRPFALASAIALLIKFEGVPLNLLSYAPEELDARFPHNVVPAHTQSVFKGEMTRYLGWRRMIFDVQLLETGSPADQDTISALMRICRLEHGKNTTQNLGALRHALPTGMKISDLTYPVALQVDKQLSEKARPPFRAAISLLDRLQDAPLAAASRHLLPPEILGRLPQPSGHLYHTPLPPKLNTAYLNAAPSLKAALPFVYRLSLVTGIFSSEQDPSLDEFARKSQQMWETDPVDYGFVKPSKVALKIYIRNIGKNSTIFYSAPKPQQSRASVAWSELRDRMRALGKDGVNATYFVSKPAIMDQLAPADITSSWVRETSQSLNGHKRNAFRSGIFVLDELVEDLGFPSEGLPRQVSGTARERRQPRT